MILKPFNQCSLKSQIALVAGALVVSVSAVLSFVMDAMVTNRIRNEAVTSLKVVSQHAARLLAGGLAQRAAQIEVLANSESIWRNGLDSTEGKQLISRVQALNSYNRWMGASDLSGKVQSASGNLLVGQNVSSRPWFSGANYGVYVGDVHSAQLLSSLLAPLPSGEPPRFLDFSAPIRVNGQTVGILAIHTGWEWAVDTLAEALPEHSAAVGIELFLFNRQGDLIYAPHGQTETLRASGQRLPTLAADDEDPTTPQKVGIHLLRWSDQKEYLTMISRLPARNPASDLGWYVVAREPTGTAFAEVKGATRDALLLGLLAAVLASAVGWLGARRLSADLKEISGVARKIEVDGGGATIPLLHSSREVLVLSESLNGMTIRLLEMHHSMESLVRDRTRDLETANRSLNQLAHSDSLTGLFNRRGFDVHLEREMAASRRSSRPLSLLMMDADHFKQINDAFGHDVGDDVLRMLAKMIRVRLRDSDVAGRYGGEEFVALLPDTVPEGAFHVAEQLVHAVAAQMDPVYGNVTISAGVAAQMDPVYGNVTISAGVATMLAAGESLNDFLRRADAALYAAKQAGRNQVCRAEIPAPEISLPGAAAVGQPPPP